MGGSSAGGATLGAGGVADLMLERVDAGADVGLLEIVADLGDAAELALDLVEPLVEAHGGQVPGGGRC